MGLIRAFLLILFALGIVLSAPGAAHENHSEEAAEQKTSPAPATAQPGGMKHAMEHRAAPMAGRTPRTWSARSLDWIGRVHPFAVHFPIALFPIAWLALILARRRGDAIDVIRSLVVVAGLAAAGAAMLGWTNAGLAPDRDWIHAWHRWLGTGLGAIGAAVAIWAWRRAASVNSGLMVWTLGITTLLLMVQGWFGGALVHGVDHMNW